MRSGFAHYILVLFMNVLEEHSGSIVTDQTEVACSDRKPRYHQPDYTVRSIGREEFRCFYRTWSGLLQWVTQGGLGSYGWSLRQRCKLSRQGPMSGVQTETGNSPVFQFRKWRSTEIPIFSSNPWYAQQITGANNESVHSLCGTATSGICTWSSALTETTEGQAGVYCVMVGMGK